MTKEKLFSITAADFTFTATKGSGAGGQHRNKASTAIRCVHPPSGAVGFAQDDRSQHRNRRLAFERCVATDSFQRWLRVETARANGQAAALEAAINTAVDRAMRPEHLLVEVGDGETWQPEEQDDRSGT